MEPQRTQRTQSDVLRSSNVWTDEDMEPDPALNEITNRIIGAALDVHKALGPGYQEGYYGNALEIAMRQRGLNFVREKLFDVRFAGVVVGSGRVDFLVEDRIVVELKAVESVIPLHASQVISYLKALNCPLGLMINFNVKRLVDGIKRIAGTRTPHRT